MVVRVKCNEAMHTSPQLSMAALPLLLQLEKSAGSFEILKGITISSPNALFFKEALSMQRKLQVLGMRCVYFSETN